MSETGKLLVSTATSRDTSRIQRISYNHQVISLLTHLHNRLSPSAYDIGWMARVRANDNGAAARWPQYIDWLIENQWADGSWGGRIPYVHDRTICTLAALIALCENCASQRYPDVIHRGEQYLWQNLHTLHNDLMELVGFELLLPTLLREARELGLNVPSHTYGYGDIRDKKLSLIPLEIIYSPGTSLAFSMEYLRNGNVLNVLSQIQGKAGAIANSPATTAYLAKVSKNQNSSALSYLNKVQNLKDGIPAFYPWRNFELAWTLQHLSYSGIPFTEFDHLSIWDELAKAVHDDGLGIDETYGIHDGDTTSVTLHVLASSGRSIRPEVLKHFENPKTRIFQTFFFERNMSVVTNVHALEALAYMPDYPDRDTVRNTIIRSLLQHQRYQSFWVDKWHISPYYATAHTILALIKLNEIKIVEYSNSIEWFIHTQQENGSWGYFGIGTEEETAYVLLSLMHYHEYIKPIELDIIRRGMDFLQHMKVCPQPYPELWVAKTLYAPYDIINALLMATFIRYEQM